jgi:hypothetical protein
MRLGFAAPIPTVPSLLDIPVFETGIADAATMAAADATDSSEPATELQTLPPPAPTATKTEVMPLLSVANAASVPIETPRLPVPALPVLPGEESESAPVDSSASPWTETTGPRTDPRTAVEAIPASAPAPPPDSIAALVWRSPTIERLPEKTASMSDYISIPAASLGAYRGVRVRLLTAGGKVVEGRVQQIEGTDVVVLIHRDGGVAEVRIPQAGIRDARVRRTVP